MGKTDLEAAKIDSICETIRDIKDDYKKFKQTVDKDINYLGKSNISLEKWFSETLTEKLSLLENIIESNLFSIGNSLSLADLVIYSFITQFFDDKDSSLKAAKANPKIESIINNVSGNVEIQSWIEKRPQTAF